MVAEDRAERGAWVGCLTGALSCSEYEAGLAAAGFEQVSVAFTHQVGDGLHSAIITATKPAAADPATTATAPANRTPHCRWRPTPAAASQPRSVATGAVSDAAEGGADQRQARWCRLRRPLDQQPTSPAVPSRLTLGQRAAPAPPLPGRARQPVCRGDISRVLAVKLRHPRSFGSLELCVGDLLGGAGEEAGDDGGHDGDRHWEDGGCDQALERSRWKRPDRVCVSYLLGLRGDSR